MIRAVIDTNLIIAYLLTQSETLTKLVEHWEKGHFIYLTSPQILQELQEVVYRPRLRQKMKGDPDILLTLIEAEAEFTPGHLALSDICRDPKDEPFISCAVEGHGDYIVTGDADLLDMIRYNGAVMIRAYDFVNLLTETTTGSSQ